MGRAARPESFTGRSEREFLGGRAAAREFEPFSCAPKARLTPNSRFARPSDLLIFL
jgi:hypothetical protein